MRSGSFLRIIINNTNQASLNGRNACLDIQVDLKTDQVEEEDDAEATPNELLNLIDRHERRSQPNIESLLEVNLGTNAEPKIVMVGSKLGR